MTKKITIWLLTILLSFTLSSQTSLGPPVGTFKHHQKIPSRCINTFKETFPAVIKYSIVRHKFCDKTNEKFYEFYFTKGKFYGSINIDQNGTILSIEEELAITDLPPSIKEQTHGLTIKCVVKESLYEDDTIKIYYHVDLKERHNYYFEVYRYQ